MVISRVKTYRVLIRIAQEKRAQTVVHSTFRTSQGRQQYSRVFRPTQKAPSNMIEDNHTRQPWQVKIRLGYWAFGLLCVISQVLFCADVWLVAASLFPR